MPYSGDPNTSPGDAVRFWLQDTGASPLLSDGEIQYVSATAADYTNGDPILTAVVCCSVLMSKYASEVSISADGVTISAEQLQDKYRQLRSALLTQYRSMNVAPLPFAGGMSECAAPMPGVRPLNFGVGMDDNREAGSQYRHGGEWFPDEAHGEGAIG